MNNLKETLTTKEEILGLLTKGLMSINNRINLIDEHLKRLEKKCSDIDYREDEFNFSEPTLNEETKIIDKIHNIDLKLHYLETKLIVYVEFLKRVI